MTITLTAREFARLGKDRTGQKPPLRVKPGSAWHKRARNLVEGPREPTPIERLGAHGYTRRASDDGIWFEGADGTRTPVRAALEDAVTAAMEAID
jgi:hypothetical protein